MLGYRHEHYTVFRFQFPQGGAQGYVYFPTSSIVSLLYVLENGSSAEIAVTGCEGLVCECYAVVKREYDRLLPPAFASSAAASSSAHSF